MSDRNLDGTHRGLDQVEQNNLNIGWGTTFEDADRALWEKKNADDRARSEAEINAMFPKSSSTSHGAAIAPPIEISGRLIGVIFFIAAFVFFHLMSTAHQEWKASSEKAKSYPTSAEIDIPEETDGDAGLTYQDMLGALSEENQRYIKSSLRAESGNVYHYCKNNDCTRPSTAELIKYVYPHIKPGRENQQRFLSKICKLDDIQAGLGLPMGTPSPEIKLALKPTATGCLIANYNQVKEVFAGWKRYFSQQADNRRQMYFTWLACMIGATLIGAFMLLRPGKNNPK